MSSTSQLLDLIISVSAIFTTFPNVTVYDLRKYFAGNFFIYCWEGKISTAVPTLTPDISESCTRTRIHSHNKIHLFLPKFWHTINSVILTGLLILLIMKDKKGHSHFSMQKSVVLNSVIMHKLMCGIIICLPILIFMQDCTNQS